MALPFSFSTNTSPTGGQLDSDLAALGAMGIISSASVGTNSITLTPNPNQPDVSVYNNLAQFSFAAPNNSTGPVTLQVSSLSPLPVYLPSGVQANTGDISSGSPYVVVFLSALNSSLGGFQIVSSIPSSGVAPAALGVAKGLVVVNNVSTPNTKITITSLQAVLSTSSGTPILLSGASAPNVTIDLTTFGANGMDVGSRPTSGWVYCYLISTGAATAGLASATSPTSAGPTLPSGYIYSMYVGAMYCDASKNLLRSKQQGRTSGFQVTLGTNTGTYPIMASGTAGTFDSSSPALIAVTATGNSGKFPLTAGECNVVVSNNWKNNTSSAVLVTGSSQMTGSNNGPAGSNGQIFPVYLPSTIVPGANAWILLESASIYWCSSQLGGAIGAQGWRDYYVNA